MKDLQKNSYRDILTLLTSSLNGMAEAAASIRAELAKDPQWLEGFAEYAAANGAPWVTESRLMVISRLGLKTHIALHYCEAPGARALAKCPMEVQAKYLEDRVTVLVSGGETLAISVHDMTALQASQVFDGKGGMRDLPAQRAWMEDFAIRNAEPPSTVAMGPYRLKAGKMEVLNERGNVLYTFTKKDLAKILADLES